MLTQILTKNSKLNYARTRRSEGVLVQPHQEKDSYSQASNVRKHLAKILNSRGFVRSLRLQRFLTFVVEESLQGRPDRLKETEIAHAVYDRSIDFDPRLDTIVRTEAVRLRKRLAGYYAENPNEDSVVIAIPRGGYVASFTPVPRIRPVLAHGLRIWKTVEPIETFYKVILVAIVFLLTAGWYWLY